jgi:hypothetical protein
MSEKYGLRGDAEIILNCLWKIGRPAIRSMYPIPIIEKILTH